ncbi:protein canopy homolog 2-like [Chiloscyllium plagiosum]|uniref:protein canopy homolog 2-like n=1 Tax=Chiloscyllium plagiosum TaxID=36176 RepID=UPI001CB7C7AE|nr:protein canopy homolog 2-like [Chiloscyllium plagiosum]
MRFVRTAVPVILVVSLCLESCRARRSADLFCGACRALVDELDWEISQVDPTKVIETGSYFLDEDGNPVATTIPYARSELFLIELLERVCGHMKEYGEYTDPDTHRHSYVRVLTRDGDRTDPPHTQFTEDITSRLKQACEKLAEEYEEEFLEFFSHESSDVKDRLCSKRTDLCDHPLHAHHDEL